jgi:transcriptional regulator with XRE-family HTH domain
MTSRQPIVTLPRLTAEDLARATGLSVSTIRNYLDRGRAYVPPPEVRLQIAAVLSRHASDVQRAASVLQEYGPPE